MTRWTRGRSRQPWSTPSPSSIASSGAACTCAAFRGRRSREHPLTPAPGTPGLRGYLNIDKPSGITSFDVVRRIRRAARTRRVGHAGTLDPLASGVLPIALGEATRFIDELVDARKR